MGAAEAVARAERSEDSHPGDSAVPGDDSEEFADRDDVDPDQAGETLDDDGTPGAGGPPPGQGRQ
jgi:hypothetical protein